MDRANIHPLGPEIPPRTASCIAVSGGLIWVGAACSGRIETEPPVKQSPSEEIFNYFNAFCREFVSHDAI
jgi:hypothetical protein